jgi:xanthine dehydrogenase accessory factor
VLALAPLPFAIRWLDDREDAFPTHLPSNASAIRMLDPEAEIAEAKPDSLILVMTHDHPLDMAITAAALKRGFPYVGLIGSATKRARFEKRFRELGLGGDRIASLVCPIGISGIADKDPAIIAASVTAQLLQVRERIQLGRNLSLPIASNDK